MMILICYLILFQLTTQNLRQWFNKQFDDLMSLKIREVGLVKERNARLRFIVEGALTLALIRFQWTKPKKSFTSSHRTGCNPRGGGGVCLAVDVLSLRLWWYGWSYTRSMYNIQLITASLFSFQNLTSCLIYVAVSIILS